MVSSIANNDSSIYSQLKEGMVKALDGVIVVHEFEIQSHYYVHFRTITLGKGIKPLNLLSMG